MAFFLVRCALLVSMMMMSSLFAPPAAAQLKGCPFASIYHFGEPSSAMVDHITSAFHLPSPNPYSKGDDPTKFPYGASFAAAGATLMGSDFFAHKHIQIGSPKHSFFNQQFDSFMNLLDSICWSQQQCMDKLGRALFFVDNIGMNDYKYAFLQGKSIKEVSSYVPQVAEGIKNTLREIIMAGATHLFVPGALPMGCLPGYFTLFDHQIQTSISNAKCHTGLNTFATLHNDHLRQALMELRSEYPHVEIVYLDYYKSYMALVNNHAVLGFKSHSLMMTCSGGEGRVCSDPETYIHWDGFRLTGEALKVMVEVFISRKGFVFPELQLPEVTHCVM